MYHSTAVLLHVALQRSIPVQDLASHNKAAKCRKSLNILDLTLTDVQATVHCMRHSHRQLTSCSHPCTWGSPRMP